MSNRLDLTGKVSGRLVAVRDVGRGPGGRQWLCRCDCGAEVTLRAAYIVNGHSQSCGCLRRDVLADAMVRMNHVHGLRPSGEKAMPEYRAWSSMIQRCTNPNSQAWKYYGGRGIVVCERWRNSFPNFLADMGLRPDGKSLDRKDVNGNYEPNNCRWATPLEQQNNRRPASEWAPSKRVYSKT